MIRRGDRLITSLGTAAPERLPFQLLESKLTPPRLSSRSVVRAALIRKLEGATDRPIVVVRGGPGYGKTTVLTQWVRSRSATAAWVSVDEEANDPIVLLSYIAVAVDRVSPLPADVFEALSRGALSLETQVLPRLAAALMEVDASLVLVLDDVHTIENPRCIDALVTLADHIPEGARLAVGARSDFPLALGRLRARSLTVEIGADDLRMGYKEARELVTAANVDLSDEAVAELVRRTEGWPAGLYLAALAAGATDAPADAGELTGNDPFVVDYLRSEFLERLPAEHAEFLTRTSILEQMTGDLCDAVLERRGSARMLEALERSNAFVVSLDRARAWYRCHNLVRDLLAEELRRSEPGAVAPLLLRAADWCSTSGHPVTAVRYAQAAGDPARVAALIERATQPVYQTGRSATVEQWFTWFAANGDPHAYPAVAVIGALFHATTGQSSEADRWAAYAQGGSYHGPLPDGTASIETWRALLRAYRARDGLAAMRKDAELAVSTMAPGSVWHPVAMSLLAVAELLGGETDAADDRFADVAEEAPHLGAANLVPVALAQRAMIALRRAEWAQADALAERAVWIVQHSRMAATPLNGLVFAVAARTAQHAGRVDALPELLAQAQRRLPFLTHAMAILAVQPRLELAWTYRALGDPAGSRTMLREVDALLRRCPDLGTLPAEAAELAAKLSAVPNQTYGTSSLTTAELRLLPLLTTHLTFGEIGERLFLSRHTVKSHAMAIYRKLDVGSRGAAVQRAQDLGLL